uniref:Synaptic plasticity regulator PANTS n=1 Tax=Anopheles christyi TaxID=43041 RepID=A0A182JTQ9_9DIPT
MSTIYEVAATIKPKTPDEEAVLKSLWSIRPCYLYNEEYEDCTSIKARFNQYFIHGESIDCNQWKRDFDNCVRFEKNATDTKSALELIDSEQKRREERMRAHYGNNVWTKRKAPPEDWAKPLPEHMQKEYESSFLACESQRNSGRTANARSGKQLLMFYNVTRKRRNVQMQKLQ